MRRNRLTAAKVAVAAMNERRNAHVLTSLTEPLQPQLRNPQGSKMTKPKHSAAAPAVETPAPAPAPQAPATATAPAALAAAAPSAFKFAIEDNVPLPTKRAAPRGETAYPFAVLNVRQSFFVPVSDRMKEPWKTLTSMASRISRELYPKRFTTAKGSAALPDGGTIEGVRIWRVEDSTEPLKEPKKLNRKPRKDSAASKEALAAEAAAGDTSQRQHPAPDFDTPPPPPAPGNPPPPPPAS